MSIKLNIFAGGKFSVLKDAILKLRSEMEQNSNNPYILVVGEFLLRHLETNPESAGAILHQDKTIGKSLNEMRKVAEKKKVGNCAVLTDQEGFDIVLKFFGIDKATKAMNKTSVAEDEFDVKLEDLL